MALDEIETNLMLSCLFVRVTSSEINHVETNHVFEVASNYRNEETRNELAFFSFKVKLNLFSLSAHVDDLLDILDSLKGFMGGLTL